MSVLAPVIRDWHRRHPDVAISLRESTSPDELLALVISDEVDVALMPTPATDRVTITAVAEEEIVLAAPTGHPLTHQSKLQLSDLDGVPLVHFAPDNGLSAWLDRSLTKAGARPEPVMRTSVTAAAPQLAAAGLGVAVCPVSAVSAGFPGVVRSFSPRWIRQLAAATVATPDPLSERFIRDLRTRGVRVPRDVRAQLTAEAPE